MSLRQAALRAAGTVAVVAGCHQAVTGVRGVRGAAGERVTSKGDRNVDSELRFYGVWYAVAGAVMHKAAVDVRTDRVFDDLLAVGWAASAVSRLLSTRSVGRPDVVFVGLGLLEAVVAAVLFRSRAER
jgi:hypothetical protein